MKGSAPESHFGSALRLLGDKHIKEYIIIIIKYAIHCMQVHVCARMGVHVRLPHSQCVH